MKRVKKKFHIYLFRHGKTTYNEKGIFTGWKDAKLTPRGIKNAKTVAQKLKNKKIDVAFQTKLSRSKDTMKEILKFHPECEELITANRMIERSYGDLEGMTHKKFIEQIGNRSVNLRLEGDALENLSLADRKKAAKFLGKEEYKIIHRGWRNPPPNGESFKMVEKRVKKFIKNLKKFMKKEKVNVAISAHGNSIRLFRKIWEKASAEEAVRWDIPYDKVYAYSIEV
ncbi:histidine phosphatase family protein [Candidatus Pacearchaeota archaeon]|nr:histidine phosphatase family protein [Candidatus Pacearchaeota archaeon]